MGETGRLWWTAGWIDKDSKSILFLNSVHTFDSVIKCQRFGLIIIVGGVVNDIFSGTIKYAEAWTRRSKRRGRHHIQCRRLVILYSFIFTSVAKVLILTQIAFLHLTFLELK